MKINSIVYWATTALLSLAMLFSAYAYLTQPAMKQAFEHLGYPAISAWSWPWPRCWAY